MGFRSDHSNGSAISAPGASGASNATGASQASGGSSSQSSAVAQSGMSSEQQKTANDFDNYKKYDYKSSVVERASNEVRYGGSSSNTAKIEVYSTPETNAAIKEYKESGGKYTIQSNTTPSSRQIGSLIVSEKEYADLHPLEQQEHAVALSGSAQIKSDSLQKQAGLKASGDYLGAYKEDVATRKTLSKIATSQGTTIDPKQESVTFTELMRTDPIIGNSFTYAQTSLFTAEGALSPLPLVGDDTQIKQAYQERFAGYERLEGGNTGRIEQFAEGTLDIATTAGSIAFGAGVGSGVKGVSLSLGKLSTTKAAPVVTKLTSPTINAGASTTGQLITKISSPINIGANAAGAYLTVDTVKGIVNSFAISPSKGFRDLGRTAIALPLGVVGAGIGFKTTSKVAGEIKTKGLQYISPEKYTVEGIPLSNVLDADKLTVSFEKNIFYPKPQKFAETTKMQQDVSSSARLPDHPGQTTIAEKQIYHATNRPFGKTFEVAESQSEIKNLMYGAPKAETYFTRIQGETQAKPGILFDIQPSSGGEILNIKGTAVKKIDYDIAARDLGIPRDKLRNNPDLQYKAADYYVAKYGKQGEFYIPAIKAEYEAGPKAGTKYRRLPSRFYTTVNDVKVKISEYEPVLGDTKATVPASGKSGYRRYSYNEYNSRSQKIPVSYSQGISSKLNSAIKGSESSASKTRSSRLSVRSYVSSLGSSASALSSGAKSSSKSAAGSQTRSISSIVYGGKSSSSGISSYRYGGSKSESYKNIRLKKKLDGKGIDIDYYKAAQRGRIDHLSLVDPLEFLGRGSLTNRKKADLTLYKEPIYLVDNDISMKKPKGRHKQ